MSFGRIVLDGITPCLNGVGDPVIGATLDVFLTGTDTRATIYADAAGVTPILNPQTSNAAGQFYAQSTTIWADASQAYDLNVTQPSGGTPAFYSNVYPLGAPVDLSGFLQNPNVALTGVPTAPTPAANDASSKIATTQFVQSALSSVSIFPPGMIAPFGMTALPAGWLACNGSAVSRSTYAALFSAIGTTFGIGDGTTTFNLPQMGGYFPRGWQSGQAIDSGRSFGTTQTDQMQGHYHGPLAGSGFFGNPGGPGVIQLGSGNATVLNATTSSPATDGANGTPRVGAETRPTNLALIFAIKT